MTSNPQLSIIIPTYNRALLLERCLECFSNQTFSRESFEVLVIDDGSGDNTKALLREGRFPFQLRPFFQDHGGAAKARNRGIRESRGEVVVFTDDDCLPTSSFLEHHWEAHRKRTNIVARGPILIIRSFQETENAAPSALSFSMNFFCTSNASVLKKRIIEAGMFDESFERWEDAELGFRLRKRGLKMQFVMPAVVHHLKPTWRVSDLIRTAKVDGVSARKLFLRHRSLRTWMSSGMHPVSVALGRAVKPWVDRKVAAMKPDDLVNGIWERLIFHRYFVEGLGTLPEVSLSVVIPTYNRLDTLKEVLDGFDQQTLQASRFEVILVDSMSTDGTQEYVEKFRPSSGFRFRYIRQENRGRPGARNRGILEATEKIVVFCDSDIIPEKTFLEKHAEFHSSHPGCAAVGWETRIDSVSDLARAQSHPEERFRIHSPNRKKLHWLYFLTGNASVPREKLVEVGLFDESFQGYGYEDIELGYRLQKAGVKIHYLPQAFNYHVHPRSLESQAEVQRLAGRNAVLFYKKHRDWRIRWLLGMSPPAFLWHRLLKRWPSLQRFLERRAGQNGIGTLSSSILIQHNYLLGVEEAWTNSRSLINAQCHSERSEESAFKADLSAASRPRDDMENIYETSSSVGEILRIAVVRLDKIGDLILTTPAIASLKRAYPDSRLTAIVNPYNKGVVEHSPDVDEVWEWEWTLQNVSRLAKADFDLMAVFSPTTASYLLALLSKARIRAGYVYKSRVLTRLFARMCLTKELVCSTDQKDVHVNAIDVPHEALQNLEVVESLGIKKKDLVRELVVPVDSEELSWARRALNGNSPIGLHLSSAWRLGLPPDFMARLIAELSKEESIFVSYGPEEASWVDTLSFPARVKRFGNISFSRWAALFHEAKVIVSTNTGAVHLAASQSIPVVAVFEPQFFAYHEKRWAPWKVPSLILRKDNPNLLQEIVKGALNLANAKKNIGSNLQS